MKTEVKNTVENLKVGEVMLTTVRKVKDAVSGVGYQIELAEKVENPNAQLNVLAALNADDTRFQNSTQKARRAWTKITAVQLKNHFGIDVETLQFEGEKQIAQVNIMSPKIGEHELCIQLNDELKPRRSEDRPKQNEKDGVVSIFTKEGKPIYQYTSIVAKKDRKHSIIERDDTMDEDTYLEYAMSVGVESENLSGN